MRNIQSRRFDFEVEESLLERFLEQMGSWERDNLRKTNKAEFTRLLMKIGLQKLSQKQSFEEQRA